MTNAILRLAGVHVLSHVGETVELELLGVCAMDPRQTKEINAVLQNVCKIAGISFDHAETLHDMVTNLQLVAELGRRVQAMT